MASLRKGFAYKDKPVLMINIFKYFENYNSMD